MKTFSSLAAVVVFVALIAVSAAAQAPGASKFAFVDSQQFFAVEGGITTITNGYKKLETELKPQFTQYESKVNQFKTLNTAFSDLVAKGNSGVPIDQADAQKKRDQLQTLDTEIKRMEEDLKKIRDKREAEILKPINEAILVGIEAFAKQKGYMAIFDIGMMSNGGQILFADKTADITGDFIKFYNLRPAGSATN